MVSPRYFDVLTAQNKHMMDESGALKKVDHDLALQQWEQLKNVYLSLGLELCVLEGVPGEHDMVFCANSSLVVKNKVFLSKMKNPERQGETAHYKKFYNELGYQVFDFRENWGNLSFEGCGDAYYLEERNLLIAGHGFRSDKKAYDLIIQELDLARENILYLKLIDERFYHLDTAFVVLNENTVACVRAAFDEESFQRLGKIFKNVILIEEEEAIEAFAANCFCPDKKNVVINQGATKFCQILKEYGFHPIEVNTSEFMKSGGSVYCMTQKL